MKKHLGTFTLFIIPGTALASGSEVLSLLWLMLLVFVIVVASLFIGKFSIKQKAAVFFVYVLTAVISSIATNDMPYLKDMYIINTVNTALPLLAWAVIYAYYYRKSKT